MHLLEQAVGSALDHGQVVKQPVVHVVLADGVQNVAKLCNVVPAGARIRPLAQRHTLLRYSHADLV